MRIPLDFSTDSKSQKILADVIQTLREYKCKPRLLYPAKLSINIDGETKDIPWQKQICTLSFSKSIPSKDNGWKTST